MPHSLSRVNLRNFLCAARRLSSDAIVKNNVNKQNFQFWNAFQLAGINKRLRDVNRQRESLVAKLLDSYLGPVAISSLIPGLFVCNCVTRRKY